MVNNIINNSVNKLHNTSTLIQMQYAGSNGT